jgi:starch synthase
MIASEANPFSKTGGLADVATALTRALGRLGHEVTLVTPRYRGAGDGPARGTVRVVVADHVFQCRLIESPLGPGAAALLLDCAELFDRAGIYNEAGVDYPDNAVRFAVLTAAAIDWASAQSPAFDIVHAHDWQAGLTPVYLRTPGTFGPPLRPGGHAPGTPGTVFTIHNLAYQGIFDKAWVPRLGLRWEDFTIEGFEFWDRLSFLKAGVNFADAITTVSPTYAHEIQRPEYGYGFDGVMRARRAALTGILNGIDTDEWNPLTDRFLPAPFDQDDLAGKAAAKRQLLAAYGLPADEAALERPVVAMVSRMVHQKGLDLVEAAAADLVSLDATFVVVGSGDARYEQLWRSLAASRPDRVGVFIGFNEARAHLVEAGADMFLMPSRFEPCGLNQMYSLRYGTVPVVRAVGGLVDTVVPYSPKSGQGTGFLFSEYHPAAMLAALADALRLYRNRRAWRRLQKNGMKKNFSWDRSAAEYITVYKRVMAARRKTRRGDGRHPTS